MRASMRAEAQRPQPGTHTTKLPDIKAHQMSARSWAWLWRWTQPVHHTTNSTAGHQSPLQLFSQLPWLAPHHPPWQFPLPQPP